MEKFLNPELKSVSDVVPSSFKQEAGNKFIDVFKFRHTHIEWMLNKTNICFRNLNDFLINGNPVELPYQKLDSQVAMTMINFYHANYKNKDGSNGAQATVACINYLLKEKVISEKDFVEIINYKFSNEAITNNELKLSILKMR